MPKFDIDNYVDVQERINTFWEQYPDGAIRTNLMSPPDDFTQCRYKAEVFKDRDLPAPDAVGWAFELAGGSGANFTSHEENCETSAIGRALANMGYAKDRNDRPSAQEMAKVNRGHDGSGKQGAEEQVNQQYQQATRPQQQYQSRPQQGGQRPQAGPGAITQPQINKIELDAKRLNIEPQQLWERFIQPYGVENIRDLTKQQGSAIIDAINNG